jgi:hypothetical protein
VLAALAAGGFYVHDAVTSRLDLGEDGAKILGFVIAAVALGLLIWFSIGHSSGGGSCPYDQVECDY